MEYREELNIVMLELFKELSAKSKRCRDEHLSDITLAMVEVYNLLCDDWAGLEVSKDD